MSAELRAATAQNADELMFALVELLAEKEFLLDAVSLKALEYALVELQPDTEALAAIAQK